MIEKEHAKKTVLIEEVILQDLLKSALIEALEVQVTILYANYTQDRTISFLFL